MQAISLNEKQSRGLCDEIGKLLAVQLDSEAIRNKVNRSISDFVKSNKLNADAEEIARNMSWSVKVTYKPKK
jgi:hypothetical protein